MLTSEVANSSLLKLRPLEHISPSVGLIMGGFYNCVHNRDKFAPIYKCIPVTVWLSIFRVLHLEALWRQKCLWPISYCVTWFHWIVVYESSKTQINSQLRHTGICRRPTANVTSATQPRIIRSWNPAKNKISFRVQLSVLALSIL